MVLMTEKYQTIKVRKNTHWLLKVLAAKTGESMLDLVERLAREEEPRVRTKRPIDSRIDSLNRSEAPDDDTPKAS
jgi:hypothetical protein